mmetsp:Transcript_34137/g.84490  ORF Transcript_34137/g.84490 Transcript_34137/m.84490 type:complete len:91 (+) Transcript_34137:1304-1576(+)
MHPVDPAVGHVCLPQDGATLLSLFEGPRAREKLPPPEIDTHAAWADPTRTQIILLTFLSFIGYDRLPLAPTATHSTTDTCVCASAVVLWG